MVYTPEQNAVWPLPNHHRLREVQASTCPPRPEDAEAPALDEIQKKVAYYQPGETRPDFEDWCREVARLHYETAPADRVPFRKLMDDPNWRAAYKAKLKPKTAYDRSALAKSVTPLVKGVLKDRTVTCAKTVVRS